MLLCYKLRVRSDTNIATGPVMSTLQNLRDESGITGIPSLPLPAEEIREHLDMVLAGNEFCSSRRSSELLRHIVERALAGDTESLKERLLGVEIFHRRSDYDTSTDAIVRVTASDVRRRLANFYSESSAQSMRITLPLGSYVPDFIPLAIREVPAGITQAKYPDNAPSRITTPVRAPGEPIILPVETRKSHPIHLTKPVALAFCLCMLFALGAGWWLRDIIHGRGFSKDDRDYAFYDDLLGSIGEKSKETQIALTNPHVLLYLGLNKAGPALGENPKDVPVPPDMAAVLNQTSNDNQANFPFHHFFVDTSNYTGFGEATAAFGVSRLLQATGRSAHLTGARFLNWDSARQEQLVILGAPHESAFVQSTLSAANFTIDYNSIHNAHPLPGEQVDYFKSGHGGMLEDYGLIWMTKSPSGTRVLVLAGLSSAGTAGVGEFFSDPERMRPVYKQLRALAKKGAVPESWQVLLKIETREYIPVQVSPVALRITEGN
jgi:hypothetical protein